LLPALIAASPEIHPYFMRLQGTNISDISSPEALNIYVIYWLVGFQRCAWAYHWWLFQPILQSIVLLTDTIFIHSIHS